MEDGLRQENPTQTQRTSTQWRNALCERPADVREALEAIYGDLPELIAARQAMLAESFEAFAGAFGGNLPVVVARAPGRVNLMGRHVDHRGGFINTIAIPNDVWIVAAARDDGRLVAHNLDSQFPAHEHDPSNLREAAESRPWTEFIDSEPVGDYLAANRGAWFNYVLGAWLRMRREFGDRVVGGMSAVCAGDVPRSVGLSSSSSVFVATMLALARLSRLDVAPERLATLCGEGEWFVGTRGGAGDHAAMLFGRRGMISQIGFFPIRLEARASLPSDVRIVLCNSGQRAEKSLHARDRFNARVAAYGIGLALLRRRCPDLMDRVEHLRDISPENLGVGVDRIYEALKTVPEWMTRDEISVALADQPDRLEALFSSHGDVEGGYPLKAVLLYGIAECERSRLALEAFRRGDARQIGRLFAISQDGDRVSRLDADGRRRPWKAEVSDADLDRLIRLARSDDPAEREQAALAWQPGAYGCSTPEIDAMVDLATATDGVLGAQLVGAGLGGSIAVLARSGAVEALERTLGDGYCHPRGLTPDVHIFQPVERAALFEV